MKTIFFLLKALVALVVRSRKYDESISSCITNN